MTVKELKELINQAPDDMEVFMVNFRELVPDTWRIKGGWFETNPHTDKTALKLGNYKKGEN